MKHYARNWGAVVLLTSSSISIAAETIGYSFDAKGRLVKVIHSGTVNNGVVTDISHDAADNRRNIRTVGASR